MGNRFRLIYWSIEINLLFWLIVLGQGLRGKLESWPRTIEVSSSIVLVGLVVSALLQHWAYYSIRKQYASPTKTNANAEMLKHRAE